MNLYELSIAYQNLINLAEETEADFSTALADLNDSIETKVENIAKVINSLEAQSEAFRNEEKRLADRRRSIEGNIKRLKDYTEESMLSVGKKRIKGELFTVAIQKNPPSLKINDDKWIPEGYWVQQEPKLNRKELLQDLRNGEEVHGVEIVQGESLRIR